MRITFNGHAFVRRRVGRYTWHGAAGQTVQDVTDAKLIAELLTAPARLEATGEFVIARDEPLRKELKLKPDQIIALAIEANVTSVADLAALRPTKALADALAAPLDALKGWVEQARALTTTPQQEA